MKLKVKSHGRSKVPVKRENPFRIEQKGNKQYQNKAKELKHEFMRKRETPETSGVVVFYVYCVHILA